MEKDRGSKIIAIIALCVAVAGISLAYAAMSTTLTIKGSATMDTASWEVKFDNLTTSTTGAASFATPPEIVDDISIETFAATLTKPGDSVVMNFDVTNGGSLDADLLTYTLGSISCGTGADATTVCNNLTYSLVYAEATTAAQTKTVIAKDADVAQGQKLLAGQTVKLKLTLAYNGTTLPASDVTITIGDTTLYYQQAD